MGTTIIAPTAKGNAAKFSLLFASVIVVAVAVNILAQRSGSSHFNTFGTYWASKQEGQVSQGLNPYGLYPETGLMHFQTLGGMQWVRAMSI